MSYPSLISFVCICLFPFVRLEAPEKGLGERNAFVSYYPTQQRANRCVRCNFICSLNPTVIFFFLGKYKNYIFNLPYNSRLGPCDWILASGMWVKYKSLPGWWSIDHLLLSLSLKIQKAMCLRWWHEKMEGTQIHVSPLRELPRRVARSQCERETHLAFVMLWRC